MEEDLILGEGEEVEYVEEEIEYSYPEYISCSVEVLTMLETSNPMTREEVKKVQELKKLCMEMLEYSVKSMHGMLFTNDI
jgi:predicted metal-dependent RNase